MVAKGFQNPSIDFLETFSPIVKASTIRVVLIVAASLGWQVRQLDINNAFLNEKLQETVYMSQPESFENADKPKHICRLKKKLYGLK